MKKILIFLLPLFFFQTLCAQNYWQQQVNYTIDVNLDDVAHMLNGNVNIEYINNSPDTLQLLYLHFWPNAYSSRQTPFARQKLENRDLSFHFSSSEERGFIDNIGFTHQGQPLSLQYEDDFNEIGVLTLPSPLAPGSSITVSSPFRVKIPQVYSRMGREGQAYYISQWFPKVAMYDAEGWHPMPYLDQGEFYSNFGTYTVSITLPQNYLVAATGNLQEESELEWLGTQIERSRELLQNPARLADEELVTPPSATEMKTITFVQENVHDFAWFADKRYLVTRGNINLQSGRSIESWAFFTPNVARGWQNALEYLKNSTLHFSSLVGEYPWETVKAVSGSLEAGGGMEYPTVTIINVEQQLERIILHEVGHNWFYGILASNEREYPWIDEGITSYYENRYYRDRRTVATYHPSRDGLAPLLLREPSRLVYYIQARQRLDQAPQLPATEFTPINYYGIVYGKAAHAMEYLELYLGSATFDSIMRMFYQEWEFRHPQPHDFEDFFTQHSGRDLSWLFHDLLQTNKQINYAITGNAVRRGGGQFVPLENRGEVNSPVNMQVVWIDGTTNSYWFEGFAGDTLVEIPNREYERIVINPPHIVPDVFQQVNAIEPGGLSHYGIRFGADIERIGRKQTLIMPAAGFNVYDGFMFGAAFYNTFIPQQRFQYAIIPTVATGSGSLAGSAEVRYNLFNNPDNKWNHFNAGIAARRFSYSEALNESMHYVRVSPYLQYEFKSSLRSPVTQGFTLRNVWVERDLAQFIPPDAVNLVPETYYINELQYNYDNNFVLMPSTLKANLQQSDDFLKLFAEAESRFVYHERGSSIDVRLFAGAFLLGEDPTGRFGLRLGSKAGAFDYTYDHWFFDRSTLPYRSIWAQQLVIADGGFKNVHNHTNTSNWLASVNTMVQLPWGVPVRLYGSAGIYPEHKERFPDAGPLSWESGLAIIVMRDIFEIYVPIIVSEDIRQVRDNMINIGVTRNYFRTISWMINFKKLHPFNAARQIERIMQ